ncbi:hypothetical protein TNCV_2143711 [Trichonephila clavipes]|nr:hypothetical protein TNCV_2143711 [Trichonephila clavipes]
MLIQLASIQPGLVRGTVVSLENSITVRIAKQLKRTKVIPQQLYEPNCIEGVLYTPVYVLCFPGNTGSPMVNNEQFYSRRSTTPKINTVKRELHSPFNWVFARLLVFCPLSIYSLHTADLENPNCLTISHIKWPMLLTSTISSRSKASQSGSLPILAIPTTNSEQPQYTRYMQLSQRPNLR